MRLFRPQTDNLDKKNIAGIFFNMIYLFSKESNFVFINICQSKQEEYKIRLSFIMQRKRVPAVF